MAEEAPGVQAGTPRQRKRQPRRPWRHCTMSIPQVAPHPQVPLRSEIPSRGGQERAPVLGSLLLRFFEDGAIVTYPNTDHPSRLADHLSALLELIQARPTLTRAMCGVEDEDR
jgi:hypothetical protein